jgi:hypothetical protein
MHTLTSEVNFITDYFISIKFLFYCKSNPSQSFLIIYSKKWRDNIVIKPWPITSIRSFYKKRKFFDDDNSSLCILFYTEREVNQVLNQEISNCICYLKKIALLLID